MAGAQAAARPPMATSAQPFELTPATPLVGLDMRSVYWIDPGFTTSVDTVERVAEALPWAVRQPGAHHNLDGKALWIQFEANTLGAPNWYE